MKACNITNCTKLVILRLLLLLAMLGQLFLSNISDASAQPPIPMIYAGTVQIVKGSLPPIPAPVGAIVSAKVREVDAGSITVEQPGKYGDIVGITIFKALLVQGNLAPGDPIDFFVNNVIASPRTATYTPGTPPNPNFSITVEDNQPPVIAGMQPAGGSSTSETTVIISASYSDVLAGVNINSVSLLLNGSAVLPGTLSATGLSYSTTLAAGTHTVTLSLSDNLGNSTTQPWSFTITNPVVITPAQPPIISGGTSTTSPPVVTTPAQPPVIPTTTPVIPVPTPSIIVTPPPPVQALRNTIESQTPKQAADELARSPIAEQVQALQQSPPDKAAPVIAEMPTPRATDVINTMVVDRAADILGAMNTNKAAEILSQVPASRAVELAEKAAVARAAQIIEQVTPDKAAQIIGQVSSVKAGDILANMAPDKAGLAMDKLVPGKLEQVLPAMEARAIQTRLPEVSPTKQYEVRPETIFRLLPQAPTEQLVRESPPVAGRGMEKPVQVASSTTSATYNVSQTRTGEWAALVGTPSPVTSILARFKESLSNVQVNLEDLPAKPAAIQAAPPGQKVSGYIRIDVSEAASKAVEVGYIRFFVEKNWLKANTIHKWSVTLSRYDTELATWMALPTKRVDEDADKVYYSATTPRFSTFAISGSTEPPAPEFSVANLAAGPTPVIAGQPIKITAEVTNLTNSPRNFAIPLWVSNTVESSQVITVAAGGKAQLSYTISRGAGAYELRIDRQIINLQVNQPTPVSTPAPVLTPAATPIPPPTRVPTVAATPTSAPTPVQTVIPAPTTTPQPPRQSGPGIPTWLILVGGVVGGAILTGIVIILFLLTKRRSKKV